MDNRILTHRLDEKNQPFQTQDYLNAIQYFETLEEYEICRQLQSKIEEIKEHEKNYTK